jgi:hypothetical protein
LPIWEKSFLWEKLLPFEGNLFHTIDWLGISVESAEFVDGSGSEAVGAIRHLGHESIRPGEKGSGGSGQEKERLNG